MTFRSDGFTTNFTTQRVTPATPNHTQGERYRYITDDNHTQGERYRYITDDNHTQGERYRYITDDNHTQGERYRYITDGNDALGTLMKKWFICTMLLLIIGKLGYAQVKFGWTATEVGISYDFMNGDLITESNLLRFNFVILDKITINVSGLNLHFNSSGWSKDFGILPIELGIAPWVKHLDDAHFFPFMLYGKGSWLFNSNGYNKFYGSVGIRLSLFWDNKDWNYFMPLTVFFEYTTAHELRIGISADLALIIAGIIGAAVVSNTISENATP